MSGGTQRVCATSLSMTTNPLCVEGVVRLLGGGYNDARNAVSSILREILRTMRVRKSRIRGGALTAWLRILARQTEMYHLHTLQEKRQSWTSPSH